MGFCFYVMKFERLPVQSEVQDMNTEKKSPNCSFWETAEIIRQFIRIQQKSLLVMAAGQRVECSFVFAVLLFKTRKL